MTRAIIALLIWTAPLMAGPYLTFNSRPLPLQELATSEIKVPEIPEVAPHHQSQLHFRGAVSQEFSYEGKPHMNHPRHQRHLKTKPDKPRPFSVSGGVGMDTTVAEKELALSLDVQNPHVPGRELGLSLSVNY